MLKNTRTNRWIAAAVALAAFVGANLASQPLSKQRLDLTQDGLYTLSDGSRSILTSLEAPVTLDFYFSSELATAVPNYGTYAGRVRDLLAEFSSVAGGNLIIREQDPKPFSETEDSAVEAGLQGVPLDAGGDKVYFGLSGFTGEAQAEDGPGHSIPFFQIERERFLEYDLAKFIYTLANPSKPKVAVVSGAQVFGSYQAMMQGQPAKPWAAISQAQEFFDMREIYGAKEMLEFAPDILLMIHPVGLEDDMLYAIDQFLMRGGRALVFLDPWHESTDGRITPRVSKLDRFYKSWGVEVVDGKIAGDVGLATRVNAGQGGEVVPAPFIAWMRATPENFNGADTVTADIRDLLLPSSGIIRKLEGASVTVDPIISTTDQAIELDSARLENVDVLGLLKDYTPGGTALPLAARINGAMESAFPDGPPQPEVEEGASESDTDAAGETTEGPSSSEEIGEAFASDEGEAEEAEEKIDWPAHLAKSDAAVNLILVADADMLVDRFWVQVRDFFGQQVLLPTADNGSFLVNALDNLHGSNELISLRSRGSGRRPFTLIADIQQEAEDRYRAEEQALREQLEATETQLNELQQGGDAVQLSDEQEAALQQFTDDLLATRKQLRAVNLSLREDIEALNNRLQFLNIGLMPLLVGLLAILLGLLRMRRRRRKAAV